MNNELSSAEAPPVPPESSLTSRLTNIFVAPGDVFAEVNASPVRHANWWVPALLVVLASWCAVALIFSNPSIKQQLRDIQDAAMQRQFQPHIDSGKMTQAQVDQIKAQGEKFADIGPLVGGFAGPLFQAAVAPFWGGFILWAGGMWVFKRRFDYLKAVEVVGLTMVVLAVGALVKGLLCAAMGNIMAAPGPILLVKEYDPTNAVHNMLMTLDIFVVWGLCLRAVGLAKLGGISLAKAAAWVFGAWIVITGSLLAFSLGVQKLVKALSGQG